MMLMQRCDNCDGTEERVFTDSWTGLDMCLTCVAAVVSRTTMSPQSEGDNLKELLDEEV